MNGLDDEQRDLVVEWCHRWECSRGADDYCGCSFDHLDRDMADRLIELVIDPLIREALEAAAEAVESWREAAVQQGQYDVLGARAAARIIRAQSARAAS